MCKIQGHILLVEKIEREGGGGGAAAWCAYVDGILLNVVWVRRPLAYQTTTVNVV